MIHNVEAHCNYLKDIFVEFSNQKIIVPQQQNLQVPYKIQDFVGVNEIWDDAKGILQNNHFYALGSVGSQGTGKTTLAQQFAMKAQKDGFKIIYALPEDYLTDVNVWIDKVAHEPSAKNCLVLDDLSYSFDTQARKQQALMKNVIARFRHIFQGQVFVIYITHRLHAAPPMLRNAGTWIFTQLSSIDRDDMTEVIGRSKEQRELLDSMQTFLTNAITEGNKGKEIHYKYMNEMYKFKWGNKDDAGDGRLMAALHNDKLTLFNSKVEGDIDFEKYRYEVDLP